VECYKITRDFPKAERFAMVQQIRRGALSVHLNIAKRCSLKSPPERKRLLEVSRGCIVEVDTAMGIAHELRYKTDDEVRQLEEYLVGPSNN